MSSAVLSTVRVGRQQRLGLSALVILLASCLLAALSMGAISLSPLAVLAGTASELQVTVFAEIRTPRVVLAAAVGSVLGIAGAALQGLFRNPLADPTLIGVSSGAALGAVAMIVLGEATALPAALTPYAIPLAAIGGAVAVTLGLFAFSQRYGQFSIVTILLVGIAINALCTVGIGIFQFLSDDRQLRTLVFWMMGSFGRAQWPLVAPALALMTLGVLWLGKQARDLDLLQLGEIQAQHLGVEVQRLKRYVVFGSAIAVGAAVALSGMIGFVGLVVPHLVRLLLSSTHRLVVPGAALLGASLMVLADLVARTIIVPAELPVSLVTSAIGAPFFLWLIARMRPA